jgi:hypothetical protein
MKKKGNSFKSFLHKLRFQYRVSVLNENTLEESWHIRLSRLSVLIYGSSLVLGTFILLTILIFTTPIKYYLPVMAIQATVDTLFQNRCMPIPYCEKLNFRPGIWI